MEPDFRVVTRRFGPTALLALSGELDMDCRPVLQDAQAVLDENVAVVVCDMHHLSFIDVTGLNALFGLVSRFRAQGIAFFAVGWQGQPRRLLDLVDALVPRQEADPEPTALLRRSLRDAAGSQRAAGARAARAEALAYETPKPGRT
ncbi:STAS domain-containing protein [Streptomyces sp. NPDC090036]|uniref:STAS domain-containing protein n=1 Tax=Streptomyces sp. NPDC090036 TaxID=3365926 RepID=UPI003809BE2F